MAPVAIDLESVPYFRDFSGENGVSDSKYRSLDSRLGIGIGIGLDVKPCIESDSESDSKSRPGQYQSRNRDSKIGTRETLKQSE